MLYNKSEKVRMCLSKKKYDNILTLKGKLI